MTISNADLKKFSSLKRKTKRKELGWFIVEGVKSCKELVKSNFDIIQLLATHEIINEFPKATLINQKEASRISNLKNHSNVIAIVKSPSYKINRQNIDQAIFLDGVKDPGNMGTIIRTLDWFGYKDLFCSEDCVDIYNSKTVMATMGSIFRLKIHTTSLAQLKQEFPNSTTFGLALNGENIYNVTINKPSIIVMGNESNGISNVNLSMIDHKLKIPGNGQAESLNVSTSTAILLSEIQRKKITTN